MKKIWMLIFAAILAALALAAYSQSPQGSMRQGPPPGMARMMRGMSEGIPSAFMIERMSDTLKLSSTQSSKIKSISTSSEKTLAPLIKKVESASEALRKASVAAKYNESNVKKLAANLRNAQAAVTNANISTWTKVRGVLTSSQITKLRTMMSQGPMGSGGQGGPGMPPAGGPPPR